MVAHSWLENTTGQADRCDCEMCGRHETMMRQLEETVSTRVGRMLGAGWMPAEIVAAVKSGAPKSSRASMLVRVELVRRAGAWQGDPAFARHVVEVEQLAKRTGFRIDTTTTGWFEQWYWNRGRRDPRLATRLVVHIRGVLEPIIDLLDPEDPNGESLTTANTSAASSATIRCPRPPRWLSRPVGNFVPPPHDTRWQW